LKDRVKDAILFLSAFGAGMLGYIVANMLGMDSSAAVIIALVAAGFAGMKVKNELDSALDRKCPKCRFANGNEANFCRNCGTPLRQGEKTVEVASTPP